MEQRLQDKSSQPSDGVEPACGSVLEQRAVGKQMVQGAWNPVSTYYGWQRKVLQAAVSENEVCLAEIPIGAANTDMAVSIQCGALRVDIHAGADTETIRAIIQTLKGILFLRLSRKLCKPLKRCRIEASHWRFT